LGYSLLARTPNIDLRYLDATRLHLTVMGCFAPPAVMRALEENGHVNFGYSAVGNMAISLVQSGFQQPPPDMGAMNIDVYPTHSIWQKLDGGGEQQIGTPSFVARLAPLSNVALILSAWYFGEPSYMHLLHQIQMLARSFLLASRKIKSLVNSPSYM
jgi:hypothetical protein